MCVTSTARRNRSGGWIGPRCSVAMSAHWGSRTSARTNRRPPRRPMRRLRRRGRFRDQHRPQGRQPDSRRGVGLARSVRLQRLHHRLRPGHHRGGRTARADGAAERGRRQDQPRRRRHRSRPERSSIPTRRSPDCSDTRPRKRRDGRPSQLLADRTPIAGRWPGCGSWIGDGRRRRGGNSRLRQERRRDLGLGRRQGVPQRSRTDQIRIRPVDRYLARPSSCGRCSN